MLPCVPKEEHIGHFKSVSTSSKISSERGGLCIYVKEYVQTKEQNCLKELCKERILKCP
jgi:hypothetical protein